MQENVVAKKIASEAKLASKNILKNAQTDCTLLQKKAEDWIAERKKNYAQKLEKKRCEIEQNNAVVLDLEAKKFELFCKQSTLEELCNAVCADFLALNEKKLLDFGRARIALAPAVPAILYERNPPGSKASCK